MTDIWNIANAIEDQALRVNTKKVSTLPGSLPTRQVSSDDYMDHLSLVKKGLKFLKPGYQFDAVPLLRKVKDSNPDVSQAFKDVIQLANTGHDLVFDPGVSAETQLEMRDEIAKASENWVEGAAGLHGIINNMFSQLLVAGAIANEWVPNFDLTTITRLKFLYPERIRYATTRNKGKLVPYQQVKNSTPGFAKRKDIINGEYIKLNPATFRYYALFGDAEIPYGTPPYLAVITGLSTQSRMLANIDNIVSIMGILGWSEALMSKPDMDEGESEKQYQARLEALLVELKERVQKQLRDGVSVGYEGDHTFDFKQTVTSADGVDSLWAQNEQQIASALDFDSAFMGRSYNTSETMITILFIKMVSQLTNMQNIVEHNLSYGLTLFLRLRGFKFKSLKVKFHPSTITDDLKMQQGLEVKARVALQNYLMGTIDEHQYAKEMGYDAPSQNSPRIDPAIIAGKAQENKDKEDKEKRKDKSERDSKTKKKEGEKRRTKPSTSNGDFTLN